MMSAEQSSSALTRSAWPTRDCRNLHLYDDDAALGRVMVLFGVTLVLRLGPAMLVTQRNFQPRTLVAPPFLFLATTDLFDDPRFEHGDREPLAKCLQYLFLLVKFGNSGRKREPVEKLRSPQGLRLSIRQDLRSSIIRPRAPV
jgi:hypothetical protein